VVSLLCRRHRLHPNELQVNTAANQSYDMQPGSMLVMHHTPVSLKPVTGNIDIAKGTAAFAVQIPQDVAVYNLSGSHDHDVDVTVGSPSIFVPIGKALILNHQFPIPSFVVI
jgi:hypothetical protein